jgi:crotonobetainyl-CoA:carnitine CoA-transferase CaiB-like acyl-CoA transferase
MGTAHASIVPYESFRTKDGYMTIGCGNDPQYEQVLHIVEKNMNRHFDIFFPKLNKIAS